MSGEDPLAATMPWKCPKCNTDMEIPYDLRRNGETVACPNCGYTSVLVKQTFPFKCVKCGNIFGALQNTTVIGGVVFCPFCRQKYRRAVRRIVQDTCQDHGRLLPVRN